MGCAASTQVPPGEAPNRVVGSGVEGGVEGDSGIGSGSDGSSAAEAWLAPLRLTQYAPHFVRAGYDDEASFEALVPDDVAEVEAYCGVDFPPGHRKKLFRKMIEQGSMPSDFSWASSMYTASSTARKSGGQGGGGHGNVVLDGRGDARDGMRGEDERAVDNISLPLRRAATPPRHDEVHALAPPPPGVMCDDVEEAEEEEQDWTAGRGSLGGGGSSSSLSSGGSSRSSRSIRSIRSDRSGAGDKGDGSPVASPLSTSREGTPVRRPAASPMEMSLSPSALQGDNEDGDVPSSPTSPEGVLLESGQRLPRSSPTTLPPLHAKPQAAPSQVAPGLKDAALAVVRAIKENKRAQGRAFIPPGGGGEDAPADPPSVPLSAEVWQRDAERKQRLLELAVARARAQVAARHA